MLRRARQKNDQELVQLSIQAGLAHAAPGRPAEGSAAVSGPRTRDQRFLVQDEAYSLEWGRENQPWPRERAEGVFQRLIKRTLAMEHFEARGFYGPLPVEVYSTSPWHALAARRYLRSTYPAFLPYVSSQALRIYHEPFGKLSGHWPRATEEKLILLDLRELRALIVGSLSTEDLLHAIHTLAGFQLPLLGLLPVGGVACAERNGNQAGFTFGRAALPGNGSRAIISQGEGFWGPDGFAPAGQQAYPAQKLSRSPSSIIFLCRDALGGLPAAARLNPEQARHFFESGYGSVAGPRNSGEFDPCYAGLSLTSPRAQHGELFANRLAQSGATAWVVNAGRLGSEPVPAEVTETCVAAIQAGTAEGPQAQSGAGILHLTPPASLAGLASRWLKKPGEERRRALENAFRAALTQK